jgi:hypothetical protein
VRAGSGYSTRRTLARSVKVSTACRNASASCTKTQLTGCRSQTFNSDSPSRSARGNGEARNSPLLNQKDNVNDLNILMTVQPQWPHRHGAIGPPIGSDVVYRHRFSLSWTSCGTCFARMRERCSQGDRPARWEVARRLGQRNGAHVMTCPLQCHAKCIVGVALTSQSVLHLWLRPCSFRYTSSRSQDSRRKEEVTSNFSSPGRRLTSIGADPARAPVVFQLA